MPIIQDWNIEDWNVYNWKDASPFFLPEKNEPVLDCDEVVVKAVYLEPGEEALPHIHKTAADIMVIMDGTGTATVDGLKCRVKAGDVIMNPPGTVHGIRNDGSQRLSWYVIQTPPPNRQTTAMLSKATKMV